MKKAKEVVDDLPVENLGDVIELLQMGGASVSCIPSLHLMFHCFRCGFRNLSRTHERRRKAEVEEEERGGGR
eukprot:2586657-Rhodomonas_salina.1